MREPSVLTERKSLLVRLDFILGKGQTAPRVIYCRWRRVLIEALPKLLGCSQRCPRAEHVCLHHGEGEGHFSAWLRIPVQRRANRKLLRKLKSKWLTRLDEGIKPMNGEVVKVGIRRCHRIKEFLPLFAKSADSLPAAS